MSYVRETLQANPAVPTLNERRRNKRKDEAARHKGNASELPVAFVRQFNRIAGKKTTLRQPARPFLPSLLSCLLGRTRTPCAVSPRKPKVMTGGQNHVVFWTLRPNLSSRLGKAATGGASSDNTTALPAEPGAPETAAERAPASNEAVAAPAGTTNASSSVFSSAEKVMAETFTCAVAIGGGAARRPASGGGSSSQQPAGAEAGLVSVAVTGTAGGAFAVWENFECVRVVREAHGEPVEVDSLGRSTGSVLAYSQSVYRHPWGVLCSADGASLRRFCGQATRKRYP